MRVLVTGASGQLGYDCVQWLTAHGVTCCGVDREDFDLTDAQAVSTYIRTWQPDAIIHCGAYTHVDRAETQPEVCVTVNGVGTLNVVRAALSVNAKLLYVSTDYVFSGAQEEPYGINAQLSPQNVYGVSKAQGEEAVRSLMHRCFIVRTGWLYSKRGNNIVRQIIRDAYGHSEISAAMDQIGCPTYSADLAALICTMISTERYGVYHAANEGCCSVAELAEATLRRCGSRCRVRPVETLRRPHEAHKPRNLRLDMRSLDAAGFPRLPEWTDALNRFLDQSGYERG